MTQTPAFRKGEAVVEAAKKQSVRFAKTEFFGLKDGETAYVRFLTDADEWIGVDQHAMVPTKGQPEGYQGNWPNTMTAVCRRDPAFTGMYQDCYICDHVVGQQASPNGGKVKKPSLRTWGLACLREEVIVDGKFAGLKDMVREVERKKPGSDETEKVTEKAIVVVAMGEKNFWNALRGFAGHYGTACDRDYKITRSGSTTDTTYSIIPMDPLTDEQGNRLVPKNPDGSWTAWGKRYDSEYDLAEIITGQSSDEFYARFFDPRFKVVGDGADRKVVPTGAAPEPKAENDVDEARLAELSARVRGYSAPESNGAPTEEKAAPAAGGMKNFD